MNYKINMGNCCSSVIDNYIINDQKTDCQIETKNSFKPNRTLLQRALIDNNHKKILIKTVSKNPFSSYEKILRSIKKDSVKKLKTSEELNTLLKKYVNFSSSINEMCYRTDSINKQFDNALSKIIEKEETFEEEVEKNKTRIIMRELNFDDENKIRDLFNQYFIFSNLNEELFQYILKELILIHLEPGKYLFCEGFPWNYFSLVPRGQIEILKSGTRVSLLSNWNCFGFESLFCSNLNTIFESNDISIKCVEKADIYLLDGETFQYVQAQRLKYKMEQFFYFSRRISSFQSLDNISKYKVTLAPHLREYNSEVELSKKNAYLVKEGSVIGYKKEKEVKRFTTGQLIKIYTLLFGKEYESEVNNVFDQLKIVEYNNINGEGDNNNSVTGSNIIQNINLITAKSNFSRKKCTTLNNTNYSINVNSERSYQISNNSHIISTNNYNSPNTRSLIFNERTLCYELSKNDLEGSLGKDFKNEILYSMFSKFVRANCYFSNLFPMNKLYEVYQLFLLKKYEPNDSIAKTSLKGNQRIIVLLEGNLINEITHEYVCQKGDIIGYDLIKNNSHINKQIVALTHCITLECEFSVLSKYLGFDILDKTKRKDLIILQMIRKIKMFNYLSEQTIITIKNKMQKYKFKSGNEIVNDVNKPIDSFWLITKGKIKITKNKNELIREVESICSFGENYIFNRGINKKITATAIDKVTGYCLLPKDFEEIFVNNSELYKYMYNCLSLEELHLDLNLNHFYFVKQLGKTKFGNVYLVHDKQQFYALKTIVRILADKDKRNLNIPYQRRIMLLANHPFIVKTFNTFRNERFCYFVSEYINGQCLYDHVFPNQIDIKEHYNIIYDQFRLYMGEMLLIVSYLKKRNIVHRDLSLNSFIIDSKGYLKLIDFASAKFLKDYACSVVGEPMYCAPEMIKGKGYSSSCDYWSIGVCGYALLYNKYPFEDFDISDPIKLYQSIVNDEIKYPKEWEGISEDMKNKLKDMNHLLKGLLCRNINKRLCDLYLIKEIPLFKGYDFQQLLEFNIKAPYIPNVDACNLNDIIKNDKEIKYLEHEDILIKNTTGKDSLFERIELWQCDCRWADEF